MAGRFQGVELTGPKVPREPAAGVLRDRFDRAGLAE
jgi:hypothetical protein